MKNIIRLSETELRNIIDESIKSVLNKGKNFIINENHINLEFMKSQR